MALAEGLDKKNRYHIYCIVSDGECQSGNLWEAVMSASKYRLDNLTVIVDNNGLQADGLTDEVMPLGILREKWQAFGWHTIEIDGHDMNQILKAFHEARQLQEQGSEKPVMILARTTKGKGVSFMEHQIGWHGVAPTLEDAKKALAELARGGKKNG